MSAGGVAFSFDGLLLHVYGVSLKDGQASALRLNLASFDKRAQRFVRTASATLALDVAPVPGAATPRVACARSVADDATGLCAPFVLLQLSDVCFALVEVELSPPAARTVAEFVVRPHSHACPLSAAWIGDGPCVSLLASSPDALVPTEAAAAAAAQVAPCFTAGAFDAEARWCTRTVRLPHGARLVCAAAPRAAGGSLAVFAAPVPPPLNSARWRDSEPHPPQWRWLCISAADTAVAPARAADDLVGGVSAGEEDVPASLAAPPPRYWPGHEHAHRASCACVCLGGAVLTPDELGPVGGAASGDSGVTVWLGSFPSSALAGCADPQSGPVAGSSAPSSGAAAVWGGGSGSGSQPGVARLHCFVGGVLRQHAALPRPAVALAIAWLPEPREVWLGAAMGTSVAGSCDSCGMLGGCGHASDADVGGCREGEAAAACALGPSLLVRFADHAMWVLSAALFCKSGRSRVAPPERYTLAASGSTLHAATPVTGVSAPRAADVSGAASTSPAATTTISTNTASATSGSGISGAAWCSLRCAMEGVGGVLVDDFARSGAGDCVLLLPQTLPSAPAPLVAAAEHQTASSFAGHSTATGTSVRASAPPAGPVTSAAIAVTGVTASAGATPLAAALRGAVLTDFTRPAITIAAVTAAAGRSGGSVGGSGAAARGVEVEGEDAGATAQTADAGVVVGGVNKRRRDGEGQAGGVFSVGAAAIVSEARAVAVAALAGGQGGGGECGLGGVDGDGDATMVSGSSGGLGGGGRSGGGEVGSDDGAQPELATIRNALSARLAAGIAAAAEARAHCDHLRCMLAGLMALVEGMAFDAQVALLQAPSAPSRWLRPHPDKSFPSLSSSSFFGRRRG
jgi:hypothetical protein